MSEFWRTGYVSFANFVADSQSPDNPFPLGTEHWYGFESARFDYDHGGLSPQEPVNTIGGG